MKKLCRQGAFAYQYELLHVPKNNIIDTSVNCQYFLKSKKYFFNQLHLLHIYLLENLPSPPHFLP